MHVYIIIEHFSLNWSVLFYLVILDKLSPSVLTEKVFFIKFVYYTYHFLLRPQEVEDQVEPVSEPPSMTDKETPVTTQKDEADLLNTEQSKPPNNVANDFLGPTEAPLSDSSTSTIITNDNSDIMSHDLGNPPSIADYVGPTAAVPTEETDTLEGEPPLAPPGTEDSVANNSNLTSDPSKDHSLSATSITSTNVSQEFAKNGVNNSNSTVLKGLNSNSTVLKGLNSNSTVLKGLNESINASSNGNGGTKNGKNDSEIVTSASTAPRDKEKSVFLRLTNQIRELELNMTIFSSYLDQISTG